MPSGTMETMTFCDAMKHARKMVDNITLTDDRLIIVRLAKIFNQMEIMLTDPDIKNIYDMSQEMAQFVKRTTVHEMSHLSCVWDLVRLAAKRIHERTTIEDYFLTLLIIGRCFYDHVQMPQDIRGAVVEVTAARIAVRAQQQIDYLM